VISIKFRGIKQMKRRLAQVGSKLDAQARHALDMEAKAVMREAMKMAPYEDSDLRDSATIHPVTRQGNDLVTVLSFGETGPSQAYALALHEVHSIHDPPSWIGVNVQFHTPGTGPKYLETPLRNAQAGMDTRIARRCDLK
jgi:hypothetical protein